MDIKIKLNTIKVERKMKKLNDLYKAQFMDKLYGKVKIAVNKIMRIAQEKTPYDTGALKNSAKSRINLKKHEINSKITFETPYAIVQHENTTFNHPIGIDHWLYGTADSAWEISKDEFISQVRKDAEAILKAAVK